MTIIDLIVIRRNLFEGFTNTAFNIENRNCFLFELFLSLESYLFADNASAIGNDFHPALNFSGSAASLPVPSATGSLGAAARTFGAGLCAFGYHAGVRRCICCISLSFASFLEFHILTIYAVYVKLTYLAELEINVLAACGTDRYQV